MEVKKIEKGVDRRTEKREKKQGEEKRYRKRKKDRLIGPKRMFNKILQL